MLRRILARCRRILDRRLHGELAIAIKERLIELGLELPPPMRLKGQRFETVRIAADRISIAGHLPIGNDGALAGPLGKVGADVSADEAYQSARQIALAMIASLDAAGVDLDRVDWRKAFGMVNAAPGFSALPGVINGFSDVLLEVFGERGRHARSAIGVAELPFGAPVEVEAEVALVPVGAREPQPVTTVPAVPDMPLAASTTATDRGLRSADYAGVSPLAMPAEAIVRSIDSLSNVFWISIAGTVVTIFLASLANLGSHAHGMLPFGEYSIPLSVLPIACLCFAMFVFWLTASRLKMLEGALGDDDLTAGMARDIFRLDPPVLDVFDAGNLRRLAPLSGFAMLLWNWSLFFGSSMGLIFSATVVRGAAASVDEFPAFLLYLGFTLAIMSYGVVGVVAPLRRILERLHGGRFKIGVARSTVACLIFVGGILMTNPDLYRVMWSADAWRLVGPSPANALDGETLMLEGGQLIVLAGIEALRPGQTCVDVQGSAYSCGNEATRFLQSLVQDSSVICFVAYPNLGVCALHEEGTARPSTVGELFTRTSLSPRMVSAGLAFAEGDGTELLGELQDEAQRKRVGAWRGSFEPPRRWAARLQGR